MSATEESDKAQSILREFLKANSTCCECNAELLNDDSAYVNLHLGITLCKDCANVLSYHESDYARSLPYSVLSKGKLPIHLAYYLRQTGNRRNKEILEFHKPAWCLSPLECKSDVVRDTYFREKYFARRFSSREEDIKAIKRRFEESKVIDDCLIDEYIDNISDNYDKFWYYLDEKTVPPAKCGPFTRPEMGELYSAKALNDMTFVWHPCIGGWKLAVHVLLLHRVRKEIPHEVTLCLQTMKKEDGLQPVRLLQGYLHMQRKRTPSQWKSRWVVMTPDSLRVFAGPNLPLKTSISVREMEVSPGMLEHKGNDLAFSVSVKGGAGFLFWSPFQKEVLEWVTELRKLRHVLGLGAGDKSAERYVMKIAHAGTDTNLLESPCYKRTKEMAGHVFFSDRSKAVKKRQSKWALLRDSVLSLYKDYNQYYDCEIGSKDSKDPLISRIQRIGLGRIVLEMHRECDEEYGFYIRIKTLEQENVYELWTDTLKEYEIWIEYFSEIMAKGGEEMKKKAEKSEQCD